MFCRQCGTFNPDAATACARCGTPLKSQARPGAAEAQTLRWTPPVSPAPEAPPRSLPPPAGFGDRFLALILDTVVIAAVFALVGMWAATRWGGVTPAGFSLTGTAALVAIGCTLLFGFLYYWLGEGLFGKTLGKGILGLPVRLTNGGRCTLSASLVRNLLRVIDGIGVYLVGFLVAVFSASRQRLGDHAARTVVVAEPTRDAVRGTLVVVWLILWTGGVTGAFLLHRGYQPSASAAGGTAPAGTASRPAGLQYVNAAFLQAADGAVRAAAPYKSGETVYLKYEVVGFTTNKDGQIELLLQAEVRDPNGLSVFPPWEKELRQTVPPGKPVSGSFNVGLPPYAPAGVYQVALKARDKVSTTVAELALQFETDAPPVTPAAGLEFRDFAMSPAQDGPAEEMPVLHGGGTVYSSPTSAVE